MEKEPKSKIESKERGENVEIILKFIRHGERMPEGRLLDVGRQITKDIAKESGIKKEDFDAIKAIGSTAGPEGSTGMARALETADIYAHEIAGDEAFNTKKSEILSYETLKNPIPYDVEGYKTKLPDNFEQLGDEEKKTEMIKAHNEILDEVLASDEQKSKDFIREIAGSFAYIIDHYSKMAKKLNTDSKVLIPAGTHAGIMEFILREALVRKLEDGTEIRGFEKLGDIGGFFNPSEAFNVDIKIDENGKLEPREVIFDNPERFKSEKIKEMYLDPERLDELAKYYAELHELK